jgi:hypothetical protein
MKNIAVLIICALSFNSVAFAGDASLIAIIQQAQTRSAAATDKAKSEVQKRGVGARVKVKLANGTEVRGVISKAEDASFGVIENKTGQAFTIAYSDVGKIQGPGLSKGAKIAIVLGSILVGVGIAIGAFIAHVQKHI